jgi:hypothetical protein
MSNRNRSRNNWQGGQMTAPGYYNPDALPASQQLTVASLDSICENINRVKQMVQSDQPDQASQFFETVVRSSVTSAGRDLRKTMFLHRQKAQSDQAGSSPGEISQGISPTRLPDDPRQLHQLLDAVNKKIARGAAASS